MPVATAQAQPIPTPLQKKGKPTTMFIRRVKVNNYMIHKSTAVELFPITVFVGSNNGGKSSMFDALLNFSMVSRGKLSQAFGPGPYSFHARRHHGASDAARISYTVGLSESADDERILEYTVSYQQLGKQVDSDFQIFDEKLKRVDTGEVLFDRSDLDSSVLVGAIPHLAGDRSLFAAIRQAQFAGQYQEIDSLVTHVTKEISRMNQVSPSTLKSVTPITASRHAYRRPRRLENSPA